MKLRTLFLLAALLALLLRFAPATLLDRAVSAASQGRLRVLQAQGSLWNGHGVFASLAADGRSAQPWLPGEWHTEFDNLVGGVLGWRLSENHRTVLHLRIRGGGAELTELAVDAPLRALLDSIPHPLARAGWLGAVRLESPGWACDWLGACRGSLRLTWIGAGVELVPGRRFGDYELNAQARGKSGQLQVRTLSGELKIDGKGGWDENGRPRFSGRIMGPPEIVSRLPNVMDGVAIPTEDPAVVELELR